MHAISHPATVSVRSVLLLTQLCLLTAFGVLSAVKLAAVLAALRYPALPADRSLLPWALLTIVLAQLGFCWFCRYLAGTPSLASVRYGMKLQLQGTIEIVSFLIYIPLLLLLLYYFDGDTTARRALIDAIDSGRLLQWGILACLAPPLLAILIASLRLHALSRRPGALAGMINGTLTSRTVIVRGDLRDNQHELERLVAHLTSPELPGLGRSMYGNYPTLTKRNVGEHSVHQLVWLYCPMKVELALHAGATGEQELQLRCVLRAGLYQLYLFPTPIDVAVQMQYLDSYLVQPFLSQLERQSTRRQHQALHDQAVEAQLRILQAQIEPHFLFNTLANLRQLYRSSNADGEHMLDHLIAYLRSAMDNLRAEYSSVLQEMDLAMHYLAIMQIRMGERLAYRFVVPDALLKHPLPPAMLISLVENAIKHGIAESSQGLITLTVARVGEQLHLSIADNGQGVSSVGGSGLGLSNIRQRLEAIYGSGAWLEVGSPAEGGFTATIIIPFEEGNVHAHRPAG